MKRSVWAALVVAGTVTAGHAAAADIFTLQNTLGGDGSVTTLSGGGFDVFGSNNGHPEGFGGPIASLTSYTATAGVTGSLSFDWTYTTHDLSGAQFDPGGYILNGVQHQLSPLTSNPIFYTGESGYLTLDLTAGDTYGFYIFSTDSEEGRADLRVAPSEGLNEVSEAEVPAGVPEPATWAMMIAGFFGLGAALRRRQAMVASA
ncbi:PEPxxWA-CTERM sorting domain-containing protein [Phenylobacterium sp.]|uniref:PEPxxWA-CTERM sorting domain-containing protein n=1 Tax=Phenylobacterium sp. TaxID=1871053 RepID=UPI003563276B